MKVIQHIMVILVAFPATSGNIIWPKSQAIDLNIQTPPHVTKPTEFTEPLYPGEETSVELSCEARGNPAPTYQWFWNGKEIPANDSSSMEFLEDDGRLVIPEFRPRHEGYFRCTATNEHGVSLSPIVETRRRVDPRFNNQIAGGKSVEVREGQGVALECYDRPSFVPAGKFSWYRKWGDKQEQILTSKDDRLDIDENGTLYITTTNESDERNDYACAAQSRDLNVIRVADTPYYSLTVSSSTVLQSEPQLLGSTEYITAEKGGEVILECYFGGSPRPSIRWKYETQDRVIVNGTDRRFYIKSSGHKLIISRLVDDDQGQYSCEGSNIMGVTKAAVYLNVTSRPLFEKSYPQIIIAPVGNDATFKCLAEGAFGEAQLPPPVWTINGANVSVNDSKFSLSEDGIELTVLNVSKSDLMCLQCNVTNSVGYAFGDGYLAVIDPLELAVWPNDTIVLEPGTTWLNLTVEVTSDACCPAFFSWFHNGQVLSKTSLYQHPYSYELGVNMATLSIRLDGPEEEVKGVLGQYRCDAFHHAYSQKRTVTVETSMEELKKPDAKKVKVTEANYWWIGVVGGVLVLLIAIIVIVLMIRYNYPRQEYLLEKEEKKHKLNPEQDLLDHSFEEI